MSENTEEARLEPLVTIAGTVPEPDFEPVPDLPSLPHLQVRWFSAEQPFHLEVWAEKSTMDDVLEPLCKQYGVNLVTSEGVLSIRQMHDAAIRIRDNGGRPVRILYLSDFDPAGADMPVGAGVRLQWLVSNTDSRLSEVLYERDIRLIPVALTKAQVIEYKLPSTPLKPGEKRGERFGQTYGRDPTELDALEALRPGALHKIFRDAILRYYDPTLNNRVRDARNKLTERLQEREDKVVAPFQERIEAARETHEQLRDEFVEKYDELLEEFRDRYGQLRNEYLPRAEEFDGEVRDCWEAIADAMDAEQKQIDPAEVEVPKARDPKEYDHPLYDSARGYVDQVEVFKEFQGKPF